MTKIEKAFRLMEVLYQFDEDIKDYKLQWKTITI